jgi:hypothetical protein
MNLETKKNKCAEYQGTGGGGVQNFQPLFALYINKL